MRGTDRGLDDGSLITVIKRPKSERMYSTVATELKLVSRTISIYNSRK